MNASKSRKFPLEEAFLFPETVTVTVCTPAATVYVRCCWKRRLAL